jgi:hypothetical protein
MLVKELEKLLIAFTLHIIKEYTKISTHVCSPFSTALAAMLQSAELRAIHIARSCDSELCYIAQSCDSELCYIAQSCDSELCYIAQSYDSELCYIV